MLLLGGLGTRLRPFTLTTPKSCLPVANVPLIHYQFDLLGRHGIDTVVLAASPLCKRYKNLFSMAKSYGIKLYLSCETKPLGTAGGIKNAEKFLKNEEAFFVFNGDILSDFDLTQMLQFHKKNNADVSIGVVEIDNPGDFGVICIDNESRIQKFVEKPRVPESNLINAGIYIIQPEILNEIPSGTVVSIEKETFPQLISSGKKIFAYRHSGYWIDVGTIEKYWTANMDVASGKMKIESGKIPLQKEFVSSFVHVKGRLITGKNVIFGDNVEIRGTVIIGEHSVIGEGSVIEDSILFKNVFIGKNSFIKKSIIGNSTIVGENCELKDFAIADNSHLCPFTKMIGAR